MNPARFIALLLIAAVPCLPLRVRAGEGRPEVKELARLMAMRLALVREVGWSKACYGIPVADPAREAHLLAALKDGGRKYSLTPGRVSEFFLPQIVASRRYQEELISGWRLGSPRPSDPPLDIAADLRPRIDRLDGELLRKWAAFPRDQLDDWSRREAEKTMEERGIPPEVARIAARPLGGPAS